MLALEHGYTIEFEEVTTRWRFDAEALAAHNIHGVTAETIKKMKDK
jgi:hypothetical protein